MCQARAIYSQLCYLSKGSTLQASILYSYTEPHSARQASRPGTLLNECRPLLPLSLPIFPPVSCQTEGDSQTALKSCLLRKDTGHPWLPLHSHPDPVSQSSSHVDLLEGSQTNSEPFPVSGPMYLPSPLPGMLFLRVRTYLAAFHHSFRCQLRCHFLY